MIKYFAVQIESLGKLFGSSVLKTTVRSPKVRQLACSPISVSSEYISMFFRVYLKESKEKREKTIEKIERRED